MLEGARLRDAQAAGVTECPKGANPERVCTGECPCAAGAGTCTDRGRTSYPARINADGVVTELEGFGAAGSTYDISTDGSVIIGSLGCEVHRPAPPPYVAHTAGPVVQTLKSCTGPVYPAHYLQPGLSSRASITIRYRFGAQRRLSCHEQSIVMAHYRSRVGESDLRGRPVYRWTPSRSRRRRRVVTSGERHVPLNPPATWSR